MLLIEAESIDRKPAVTLTEQGLIVQYFGIYHTVLLFFTKYN